MKKYIFSVKNLDVDIWKKFLFCLVLLFILRLFWGLVIQYFGIQVLIGIDFILNLYKLEQVFSDEGIGILVENLLEVLWEYFDVNKKIDVVCREIWVEKKCMVMVMRQKVLGILGMMINEKGQVVIKIVFLKQMEELIEEFGFMCCICREGYKFQFIKVLGIYIFMKWVVLEEMENKFWKQQGYSIVFYFNIVYYDCYLVVVRLV